MHPQAAVDWGWNPGPAGLLEQHENSAAFAYLTCTTSAKLGMGAQNGPSTLQNDVLRLDFVFRANEDCCPLDGIAQLPDIPRPTMLDQNLECIARDGDSGMEPAGEGDGQVFQVAHALPE